MNALDFIKAVADLIIIPLCGILWGMQGRLSRIEGQLSTLTTFPHKEK